MGELRFALCCLPSPGPAPLPPPSGSLSSPSCSRDGSSLSEQFPISFVHAGSSNPAAKPPLAALPLVPLNFAGLNFCQRGDERRCRVCHLASLSVLSSLPPFFVCFCFPSLCLSQYAAALVTWCLLFLVLKEKICCPAEE